MRIALFGNTYRQEIIAPTEKIVGFFAEKDVKLLIFKPIFDLLQNSNCLKKVDFSVIENDHFEADLALSIGGDGTFLTTAQHVGEKNIPILGINMGRLGFLADVATCEIESVLNEVVNRNFSVEERTVLEICTTENGVKKNYFALNEVAVLKQDLSSMINIKTFVNGEYLHTYCSDGLIVSTPTGSTAYSMSVGGPILVPQTQNLIVAPVASHSLNVRPLIIPDSWEVSLEVASRSHSYLISADGRSQVVSDQTRLHIKRANHTIKIVKLIGGKSFFDTLKAKLMWGIDKRFVS